MVGVKLFPQSFRLTHARICNKLLVRIRVVDADTKREYNLINKKENVLCLVKH